MNGEIAQLVALTAYGNHAITSGAVEQKCWPDNSTYQFCNKVEFVGQKSGIFRRAKSYSTPDKWFDYLVKSGTTSLELVNAPRNADGISDRMSAGFVGGSGIWGIISHADIPLFWHGEWIVGNQEDPDRKIWNVTYQSYVEILRRDVSQTISSLTGDLAASLDEISEFASRNDCEAFVEHFQNAKKCLGGRSTRRITKILFPIELLA